MLNALLSFALLAFTVVALLSTRRRGLVMQVCIEVALLLMIGAFLFWHGAAPMLRAQDFPAGLAGTWLRALAMIWWLVGARFVANVAVMARGRDPKSREVRLISELIAAVIYITAILIILDSVFDLPIKGLLATSGIVAIVLGLALQNTLADVFAGIAVGMEKPFHVGDRVSLGKDIEGVLVQINWRSIRIRTDGEDLATIPNSAVAKGQIINHSVPTARRGATVEVATPSGAVPDLVLELMRQATLLCPEVLAMPAPALTMRRAGIATATYGASFFVNDSATVAPAKSMLLRQIRRVFHHAGVGQREEIAPAALLASIVLFEALSGDEVQRLAARLITHIAEPGDVIFEQASAGTSIYVVQAGVLEIARQAKPAAVEVLGRIGPGEYIGEVGLITGAARGVTMTALTQCRVLELPGESLGELLQSNERLRSAMARSVRKGLAHLQRDGAARAASEHEQGSDLLSRIRAFFRV